MDVDGWPPRFSLDGPSIMQLLTGDRFYSSYDAALREVILNAIDACGRRGAEGGDYQRFIRITFDETSKSMAVQDNGDGMSKDDISHLFARIGASASRALKKARVGSYEAVGEFGIGVVSYFLVCDKFELHTVAEDGTSTGLVFTQRMFNMQLPAEEIACRLETRGTMVVLHVSDAQRFDGLIAKFPHWVRDVPYLSASSSARGALKQGGRRGHATPVTVPTPDWIEKAELGPPTELDYWRALDGNAHVDVLYRGVFVQDLSVPHLWGIEGSLHVNPKKFKPKLNRESFIAEGFDAEMQAYLRQVHPAILDAALANMHAALANGEQDGWGIGKWVTVWLAIPRGGSYAEVAQRWDDEFRSVRAFRQLTEEADLRVSLKDIEASGANPIYIVPNPIDSASLEARKAISVLRARGEYIIQGLQRDGGFLSNTSLVAATTAELLLNQFRAKLPHIVNIEEVARKLIQSEETLADVFGRKPSVHLVRLGVNAAPVARVDGALWVNAESEQGRAIVREICDRNEGYLSLLVGVHQHAPQHAAEVVQHLHETPNLSFQLGPVRRQYLRGFVK